MFNIFLLTVNLKNRFLKLVLFIPKVLFQFFSKLQPLVMLFYLLLFSLPFPIFLLMSFPVIFYYSLILDISLFKPC